MRWIAVSIVLFVASCGVEPCTIADNSDGTKTITCADGSSATMGDDRDCSVTDNGEGTKTIACDDGTSARVLVLPQGGILNGSYTIQNELDLALLADVTEITGRLTIDAPAGLESVALPALVSIGEDLFGQGTAP